MATIIKHHRIGGYTLELYLFQNAGPSEVQTDCDVSCGHFHASLACLQGTGRLYNSVDQEHEVPGNVVDKISSWAEANGY